MPSPEELAQMASEAQNIERENIVNRIKLHARNLMEEPGANEQTIKARRDALILQVRNSPWPDVRGNFRKPIHRGGRRDIWSE